MFLATINKPKQLLYFSYFGHVKAEDLKRGSKYFGALLEDLPAGFQVLADFSRMESMDIACVPEIGKTMELLERHQVGLIVRLLPDPEKDIGLNIISAFHYKKLPHAVTCETMEQAAKLLSL